MKEKISEFVYSHREEMVDIIRQLVEIPSVKGKPEQSAPFGAEPRRALDKMLEICREHGFVTGCHDNVMGTADYAPSGKVGLGILCHLDVVPAEPLNWSCPPFQLTRRDGKLFGRGVIDDKGPCAASLMALYCIKELGIPLKKGVRLLFGTDEENGSEDLEIYRSTTDRLACTLTREGVTSNIFAKLDEDSTLTELQPGDNVLSMQADSGAAYLQASVSFYPMEAGILPEPL